MVNKPIRVRLTKASGAYPKGAELGFASEKAAASVLEEGAFEVVGYQNGEAWDGGGKKSPAPKPDKSEK